MCYYANVYGTLNKALKDFNMTTVLVTGGAGYIGSHTVIELVKAGYTPVIFDNLCNSKQSVLKRLKTITGQDIAFVKGDIRSESDLEKVFTDYSIDAVINFAGLKAVGESVKKPLEYYDNNVNGARTLLAVMKKHQCFNFIFSIWRARLSTIN